MNSEVLTEIAIDFEIFWDDFYVFPSRPRIQNNCLLTEPPIFAGLDCVVRCVRVSLGSAIGCWGFDGSMNAWSNSQRRQCQTQLRAEFNGLWDSGWSRNSDFVRNCWFDRFLSSGVVNFMDSVPFHCGIGIDWCDVPLGVDKSPISSANLPIVKSPFDKTVARILVVADLSADPVVRKCYVPQLDVKHK